MKRKIIKIDEDLCTGCGLCADACHEGAIGMVDGKAKLLSDHYCDGLGDCLPVCPTGAITFEEREAGEYDEEAVKARMKERAGAAANAAPHAGGAHEGHAHGGCPGMRMRNMERKENTSAARPQAMESELRQWPIQIKLVPVEAPFFDGANLLIAADCTAFAYANFHNEFTRNHITLIGCPKLDMTEYEHKLTDIMRFNDIKSLKIVRMEVPCCGGIEYAAKEALKKSGKFIPWQVVTISTDGRILNA